MKDKIISVLENYEESMNTDFFYHNAVAEEIQEDIRNKLSPIKNLVALIEAKEFEFALASLKQVKESINYLSGEDE